MMTDYARDDLVSAEAHQAAIAAMPLQLLNYAAELPPPTAAALVDEARRQLSRLSSQPWRDCEAHALMGQALREAAKTLGVEPFGLELRQAQPPAMPALGVDQRSKPRTIQLNDARWEKLQALGPQWLERMLDNTHLGR
ncbi:hypothetical protein [Azohydromonas lata]|uniref:Uncharacterized protein n=1 Tax=Azohydromonas lata TaxID=45677 RepID=A0ABU5IA06_9BURK|nr:hypothetical protein [Azohydromonas lata]MDZ5455938.1 hypothetical protein [Azohydromonas lata]